MRSLLLVPHSVPEGHTTCMAEDSERFWDERYREEEAVPERGPAAFLVEHRRLLPTRGRALDVAMGTGRNTLYLASLGYEVTGIDVSGVAVARCREEAVRLGLRVEAIQADLESYEMASDVYDLVIDFYYLRREAAPQLTSGLPPGGGCSLGPGPRPGPGLKSGPKMALMASSQRL